ncbi:MAG: hypothetical protein R3286_11910 [Gammaproteobacteria bacterium]|nr:hypothetical protein [Gammaproteobacteria bacterium]
MLETSPRIRMIAHRCGVGAAVLWWGYAMFSTAFFTALSGTGLALYLLGLVVVYFLASLGFRALAWLITGART